MEAEHFSKEWDNAPMPHAIFFTDSGHAIHGTESIKQLGASASHGCIRLSPQNAKSLYAIVHEQGLTHTTIVVTGDVQGGPVERVGQRSHVASSGPMNRKPEVVGAEHPVQMTKVSPRSPNEMAYQTFGDFQPDYAYDRFK
jgi:hypothetical protein